VFCLEDSSIHLTEVHVKKRPFFMLVSILTTLSLILSACGTADETYTEEPFTTEEAVTEEAATEAPVQQSSAPGDVVFDFGFNPADNGFSFENYGDDIPATNLTATELRRMFGDEVCADINGDKCILTPPAEQWMEQVNGDMAGGH
jgi:hypothetical protein